MYKHVSCLLLGLAVAAALPQSPILRKLSPGLRYEYVQDDNGQLHLVDLWGTLRDLSQAARYNPDTQNVYHLFTRKNPTTSQPIVLGNLQTLWNSNFDPTHRTVIVLHGWGFTALSPSNAVLVPAFLHEDANVIMVDWSVGSGAIFVQAVINTVLSGQAVARFVNWLDSALPNPQQARYHIAGFSLGGQQSGIIGRNLARPPAYITCLDPAGGSGWVNHPEKFRATDGEYTEVIHTNVEGVGYEEPCGDVDFYPNGGHGMPGCVTGGCDHDRAYFYFAESLQTGGFTGQRCASWQDARVGNCNLPETLQLGGLEPKTGKTGVYYMATSSSPPFSLG